jgi:hypothetical protein
MRGKKFWIAAKSFLLVGLALLTAFSFGAPLPDSKEKVIYSFKSGNANDGNWPLSDLVADVSGNLYGTTSQGGNSSCLGYSGCGTVFELKRTSTGWEEEVLYRFSGRGDGAYPNSGPIIDAAGNLFGTTIQGGSNSCYGGCGTVFELIRGKHSWTEQVLYTFAGSNDGIDPVGGVIFDTNGNLYGATSQGGTGSSCSLFGCGTVFELSPSVDGSWKETIVYNFTGSTDGGHPASRLIFDQSGNLYGTTGGSGNYTCTHIGGCGNAYRLAPGSGGSWTETALYDFKREGGQGIFPSGSLLLKGNGELYGATTSGGDGDGTVFELHESGKDIWQRSSLHIFYGTPDGKRPADSLIHGNEDVFFGVTNEGGANYVGSIFELRRSNKSWKEKILHSFGSSGDGAGPSGRLLLGSNGHLYGVTVGGGKGTSCQGGCGTVYELVP